MDSRSLLQHWRHLFRFLPNIGDAQSVALP